MSAAPLEATLRAARVLTPSAELAPGWVRIAGGRVEAVGEGVPAAGGKGIDLGERICAPGFIDLHVHGGDGAQFNAANAEQARRAATEIARFHLAHGTTGLLATTVSDSPDRTIATLRGLAAVVGDDTGCRVLGVHLEGPWLAPSRAGAQDPEALREIDPDEVARLLEAAAGTLRIVTLAPELPGAGELIAELAAAGVVPAIGHTDADYDTALEALRLGARHFTHLFNAMRPPTHRKPGPVGVALTAEDVAVELIADGRHVHPAMLAMAFRRAHSPVLITDATAAAGLPEGGRTRLGRLEVVVRDGTVTLAEEPGTLAGSALTMDAAVRTIVERAGITLREAVAAASAAPAAVLGLEQIGRLRAGGTADLVVLEPQLDVAAVLVAGRALHDPAGLLGEAVSSSSISG